MAEQPDSRERLVAELRRWSDDGRFPDLPGARLMWRAADLLEADAREMAEIRNAALREAKAICDDRDDWRWENGGGPWGPDEAYGAGVCAAAIESLIRR